MKRRRPSAALVVAATALVVAIGGTAIAAVGAIPSDGRFTACYQTSDSVLNRIVLLAEPGEQCPNSYARVSWPAQASGGQSGPQGPAGPQGPQGVAGPAGPRGKDGGSERTRLVYSTVERERLTDERGNASARCPKGTFAVGGGGTTKSAALALSSSRPLLENGKSVGWTVNLYHERGFRVFENVPQKTRENRGAVTAPGHDHTYFLGPFLMATETRALASDPPPVTVFAVCVRLTTFDPAKAPTAGTGTRKGS
jgi:hypothetical protein